MHQEIGLENLNYWYIHIKADLGESFGRGENCKCVHI